MKIRSLNSQMCAILGAPSRNEIPITACDVDSAASGIDRNIRKGFLDTGICYRVAAVLDKSWRCWRRWFGVYSILRLFFLRKPRMYLIWCSLIRLQEQNLEWHVTILNVSIVEVCDELRVVGQILFEQVSLLKTGIKTSRRSSNMIVRLRSRTRLSIALFVPNYEPPDESSPL